jgi:hypothetical protein
MAPFLPAAYASRVSDDNAVREPGKLDAAFAARLVESLPAAAFVIDSSGTIVFASPETAALVERDASELIGQSVLSYVDEDTAWAYAAAVAMASDFGHVVLGPLRITLVTASGEHRSADLWATNRLDDDVLGGIVCLLTPATVAMGLSEAMVSLAGDVGFETVAGRVVRAVQGHPTTARAALLAVGPSGFTVVAASDERLPAMTGPGPWDDVVTSGVRFLAHDLDDVPAPVATAARAAGCATVWVEPVGGEQPRGVLVLWRSEPGRPTPNELNAVHQAAAILTIAWERHEQTS